MDEHHRKIDLQSPSDLTYLLENIQQVARAKIDLAIPPSAAPDGEDAYRARVEELVQTYVTSTLSLAIPSLTLNGLDPSPSILQNRTTPIDADAAAAPSPAHSDIASANYEQYDSRLGDRLRTLYAQLEDESTKVAELRREAPLAAARAYQEALEIEMTRQAEIVENEMEGRFKGNTSSEGLTLGRGLARKQDVSTTWGSSVEKFTDIGRLPGVLAVLERAEQAIGATDAS